MAGTNDGLGAGARFGYPAGLALDAMGTIHVADRNNCTICRIGSAGQVTTLAGMAGVEGCDDGECRRARFTFPCGVVVDGQGSVYVADTWGSTIRLVRASAPPLPVLRTSVAGNRLVPSWPASATGFVLQSRRTLTAESVWAPVADLPTSVGCDFFFTNNLASPASFFRQTK
jgi:hypothetical protein